MFCHCAHSANIQILRTEFLDLWSGLPSWQSLFVAVQLQEELWAARQESSRQHVRELKLDLRTAQLTSAAFQKQVRQCLTVLVTTIDRVASHDVNCIDSKQTMPRLQRSEAKYIPQNDSPSMICVPYLLLKLAQSRQHVCSAHLDECKMDSTSVVESILYS